MAWIEPVSLKGKYAILELLSHDHLDDLVQATKDGELWKIWYAFVPSPDNMREAIDLRLHMYQKGEMLPFAVIDAATGKAVGITTYLNIDPIHQRLEIGATWYRKSSQRTALNTECKYMLLKHAFEDKNAIAVDLEPILLISLAEERLSA